MCRVELKGVAPSCRGGELSLVPNVPGGVERHTGSGGVLVLEKFLMCRVELKDEPKANGGNDTRGS